MNAEVKTLVLPDPVKGDICDRLAQVLSNPVKLLKGYPTLEAYKAALNETRRDLWHGQTMLAWVNRTPELTGAMLVEEFTRPWRVKTGHRERSLFVQSDRHTAALVTLQGMLPPTEPRKAVCEVLARALWKFTTTYGMPPKDGWRVMFVDAHGRHRYSTTTAQDRDGCEKAARMLRNSGRVGDAFAVETIGGKTPADWLRKHFSQRFGTAIQKRWFN